MSQYLPLHEDKKLSIRYFVEAGCLGPEGKSHISAFCDFAQSKLQALESDCFVLCIEPKQDKSLPEIQFSIVNKMMNRSQAEKYLAVFDQKLDDFEEHLVGELTNLINEYMGH